MRFSPWTTMVLACLGLAASAGLAACGGGGSSTGSSGASTTEPAENLHGTVTLGAVYPLTGSNAVLGEDEKRGTELAVEQINGNGGVLGKKLEVEIEDSEGTAAGSVGAAKKLVGVDHVPVVVGEYSSGNTIPMAQYLQQQGVVSMNPISSSPEVAEVGNYSFSIIGLDNVAGEFAANQIYNELGKHEIALLAPNNSYGVDVASAVEKAFVELGGKVALKVLYTEGQSEYRQDLARIQAAEPEMLAYTAYGVEAQIMNKEAYELGMETHDFYGIYVTQNVADADEEATDGQVGMDVNYIGGRAGKAYQKAYEEKFHEGFSTAFSGYVYDAIEMSADAIERAKSVEPAAIQKALTEIGAEGYEGVTGEIKWDAQGQRIKQPYIYEEVVDGKPVQINPKSGG